MSGNESGEKRATAATIEQQENIHAQQSCQPDAKRAKLNNDDAVLTALPTLPSTLILDKAHQDTINQLVEGSSQAVSLSAGNAQEPSKEIKVTEEANKIMEPMESADIEKPVTDSFTEVDKPTSVVVSTTTLDKEEKPSATDDLNITSEQLLFALTSAPPTTEVPQSLTGTNSSSETVNAEATSTTAAIVTEASTKVPASDPQMVLTAYTANAMEIDEPTMTNSAKEAAIVTQFQAPSTAAIDPLQKMSPVAAHDKMPSTTTSNGLGTTPNKHMTASLPQATITINGPAPVMTNNAATATSTTNHIPPQTPAQLKTNGNSPSLTNALSSLPDISAALRRLSSHTVPASVIEHLSSSPRLPNIGHMNKSSTATTERRSSIIDVSPSEILGNALAAVAANAAAAASQQQQQQQQQRSSPKQPSTTQQQQTNTATAIGNLAAITANISNLLHSGGFHRNSFSQEDTQKLAAAVAVARNQQQQQQGSQQQRRKSSMAAFSNMIDQAMLMNRKSSHIQTPPPPSAPPQPQQPQRPKLLVKNELVWKSLEGITEKHLGYHVYAPEKRWPNLENGVNGIMEIRVPARYLTFDNMCVRKRALWGTDVYTDDSDIVAMAIHSGKYSPKYVELDFNLANDPFLLAITGHQEDAIKASRKLAVSGQRYMKCSQTCPDHDLKVIVRILPTLQQYTPCIRHRIKSRAWTKHDGMSLYVVRTEKIIKGEARLRGRSSIKSSMFAYEGYRRKALGLSPQQKKLASVAQEGITWIPPPSPVTRIAQQQQQQPIRGRVKQIPRVMRNVTDSF